MQGKPRKSKQKAAFIYKPYLKGNWRSVLAAKRGLRILVYQVAFIFAYLFIGQVLLFNAMVWRVLANLLVLLAFGALLYNDGARMGMEDVTFAEIALARREAGKEVTSVELDRCYHPLKGFFTVLVGTLPLILLSLVFALIATEQHYRLGSLPGWVAGFERRADVGLALQYYHEHQGIGLEGILRIVVRLLLFPFVNMIGTSSSAALLWLERLSPLLVCLIPLGYAFGYLQGPRLRAGVHGAISTDARRRVRRQKKERAQRQQPRNLV